MSKRILVVDDEHYLEEMMTIVFSRAGYEVVAASSGEDALAKARTELEEGKVIDAIVTDNNMGGKTGVQLIHDIRKLFPEIVALLTTGRPQEISDADKKGFAILPKPADHKDMVATVEKMLSERKNTLG